MTLVVITGGIGSGKSEVCRILSELGFTAQYNADARVKALYQERPGLLAGIEDELGLSLRDEEGGFMPKRLAERIFTDKAALAKLESLVFPALMNDFSEFARLHSRKKVIVFESATILEKDYFDGFGDWMILVDAPYELRLSRAAARDGASREDIQKRMSNQPLLNLLSEGGKDPRIDAVIKNDGSLESLKKETLRVIKKLKI